MLDSKCIQVIRTLSQAEMDAFRDFVRSPYHNSNKKAMDLYELIYPYFPVRDDENPERRQAREYMLEHERVFAVLFPDKKKGGTNLNVLMTALSKLLESFLNWEAYKHNAGSQQVSMLRALSEREGLEELFKKRWTEISSENEKRVNGSIEAIYQQFELEDVLLAYSVKNEDRQKKNNLGQTLGAFNDYLLANYFKYSLAALNRSVVTNEEFALPFLTDFLKYVENAQTTEIKPVVYLYYNLVRCFQAPEVDDYYQDLRKSLSRYNREVVPSECLQMYLATVNYLLRKRRTGVNTLPDIFECYREAEECGSMYEDGYMLPSIFTSVVNTGLALARVATTQSEMYLYRRWVEDFILRSESHLKKIDKEYVLKFVRTLIHFADKEYGKALRSLPEHSKDAISECTRRQLQMRIYYELGEDELLASFAISTAQYVRRLQTISAVKIMAFKNFIKSVEKLSEYRVEGGDSKELLALKKEIMELEYIEHKDWLLQKINEFQIK